jgi:hypothetical protein
MGHHQLYASLAKMLNDSAYRRSFSDESCRASLGLGEQEQLILSQIKNQRLKLLLSIQIYEIGELLKQYFRRMTLVLGEHKFRELVLRYADQMSAFGNHEAIIESFYSFIEFLARSNLVSLQVQQAALYDKMIHKLQLEPIPAGKEPANLNSLSNNGLLALTEAVRIHMFDFDVMAISSKGTDVSMGSNMLMNRTFLLFRRCNSGVTVSKLDKLSYSLLALCDGTHSFKEICKIALRQGLAPKEEILIRRLLIFIKRGWIA